MKWRSKSQGFFSSRRRKLRIFVYLLTLVLVECVYSPGFYLSNQFYSWMCQENCRPDTCNGCVKHDFTHLIRNSSICQLHTSRRIDLMIVVPSEPHQHARRNVLRQTWLSIAKQNSANVRYAFLLGASENRNLMQMVYKENLEYGDILMDDFADSYLNLTHKTIMGIKWAATYCRHAGYFLKADQDVWVNVPRMLDMLSSRSDELRNNIGGLYVSFSMPFRLPFSKWYTTVSDYPHLVYPSYCAGPSYVTSMDVVEKVNRIYPDVPFFKWEDVYVTLCLKQIKLGVTSIPGFNRRVDALDPCHIHSDVLTIHRASPDLMVKYMDC